MNIKVISFDVMKWIDAALDRDFWISLMNAI